MPDPKSIAATGLKARLDQNPRLAVVDVLPPEHYQARHIPGALNQCVYEIVFLDQITARLTDQAEPVVVYSASSRCQGARDAAEKLLDAGYADVTICLDGLEGWVQAGYPVEGTFEPEPSSPDVLGPVPQRLSLDTTGSRVEWTGRNRSSRHVGTVGLARGELVFEQGRLAGGSCELDMRSLANEDLQDAGLAAMLVAHLSSRDFFLVERYPHASFETTRVTSLACAAPGAPNYEVEGQLLLRGQTRDLRIPVTAERLDSGCIAVEAHFDLDRTRWGAIYGCGRFFEKLGMHLVHDLVSIQLRLVTVPAL